MLSSRFLYPAILLVWLIAGCQPTNTYVEPPPPEVTVAPPLQMAVTTYVHYTGTTHAVAKVDVRARVKGFLKKRFFEEGSIVKEGQLLLVIDEEPFTVQLDQARARLAEAEASLKKAEESRTREVARAQLSLDRAQLVLSQIDEMRSQNLFSRKAASREDIEKAESTRKKNASQVEADVANLKQLEADYEINMLSARASIKAAMTAVRTAEIDLGYCRVRAPIEGRITRAEVDAGNYVGDGQATLLASIHKLNPIYAYMYVSEDDMLRARKAIAAEAVSDKPRTPIKLEMGLANEEGYPHQGRADYTDPGVDPGTGTIRTRGVFENPGGMILPGLFVRVRAAIETRADALLVPSGALGFDQAGEYLLVVGKNNVVERRHVRPRDTVDERRVVEGDIRPNDLVIIEGLQRARVGFAVVPKRDEPKAVSVVAPGENQTTRDRPTGNPADRPATN
jgi:membrane fusion protein (multidrug efflux system)